MALQAQSIIEYVHVYTRGNTDRNKDNKYVEGNTVFFLF